MTTPIEPTATPSTTNPHYRALSVLGDHMGDVLRRLFEESAIAMSPTGTPDRTQSPAIPECMVLLRGHPGQFEGVLSITPEGTLKLGTMATVNGGKQPVLIEFFFRTSDLVSIAVKREMAPAVRLTPGASAIWTPGS